MIENDSKTEQNVKIQFCALKRHKEKTKFTTIKTTGVKITCVLVTSVDMFSFISTGFVILV